MRSAALITQCRVPLDGTVPFNDPPHPWNCNKVKVFLELFWNLSKRGTLSLVLVVIINLWVASPIGCYPSGTAVGLVKRQNIIGTQSWLASHGYCINWGAQRNHSLLSGDNSGSEEIANIREWSRYTRKCKTFFKGTCCICIQSTSYY